VKPTQGSLAFIALLLVPPALAVQLPDPTRPPRTTATGEAMPELPAPPSVIVRTPSGYHAWLDGRWVRAGERLDASVRVEAVTANGVRLHTPRGRRWLSLHPDVQVRPSDDPPSRRP